MAMCVVELLFLAVLGWRLYRARPGPLLDPFFLVLFGAFITPQLQDITAAFTTHGLDRRASQTIPTPIRSKSRKARFISRRPAPDCAS